MATFLGEAAVVFPVTFLLLLGLLVGGMGVFRYQEVVWLARDTARFASTHGGQYASENAADIAAGKLPSVDKAYLIDNYIKAQAGAMDKTQFTTATVAITLTTFYGTYDWDDTAKTFNRWPTSLDTVSKPPDFPNGTFYQNTVTVTVNYTWVPEFYFTGPITLTSKSAMPMNY